MTKTNTYKVVVKKVSENYILTTEYVEAKDFTEAEFLGWKKAKNTLHNSWTFRNDSHLFIYKLD